MRRNYYALESSSIKESFDSDVFSLYDDQKFDGVTRPPPSSHNNHHKEQFSFNAVSMDEEPLSVTSGNDHHHDSSFDSVISNFKSFEENPIISNGYNKLSDLLRKYRATSTQRHTCHRTSIEQLRQVQSKVKEINDLDYNVNSLIFKAVEVHTDILVSGQFSNRFKASRCNFPMCIKTCDFNSSFD